MAAVRRGIVMGRPKVVTAEQAASALRRFDGGESVRNLATTMGVSESALRAALYEAKHGHRIVRRPPRPVLGPLLLT